MIDRKRYIFAGDERIAIYSAKTSGQTSLKYLHADHLGSTDTISDASGAVIERLSYVQPPLAALEDLAPHGKTGLPRRWAIQGRFQFRSAVRVSMH